jgi:hypothetical protein
MTFYFSLGKRAGKQVKAYEKLQGALVTFRQNWKEHILLQEKP